MHLYSKNSLILVFFVLLTGILIFTATGLAADEQTATPPEFKLNFSFDNNLILLKDKNVHILLNSGTTLNGKIKDIQNGLLHLEKIAGRNYFDALIRVKDISAVEAQFRGLR